MKEQYDKLFNLDEQYRLYLERAGVTEQDLPLVQRIETKRAFMGACGQMLVLFRDAVGAIENEMEAIAVMESLSRQVADFWQGEMYRQDEYIKAVNNGFDAGNKDTGI